MFPPKVSDGDVRAMIRTLSSDSRLPSGAALRSALEKQYGVRGGVSRIYRLLAQERQRPKPPIEEGDATLLRQQLQAMQGRAERAEDRELAHQDRWAAEIDQLRQKLLSLEAVSRQAHVDREQNERLRQRLQAAERRASILEEQLLQVQQRPPP